MYLPNFLSGTTVEGKDDVCWVLVRGIDRCDGAMGAGGPGVEGRLVGWVVGCLFDLGVIIVGSLIGGIPGTD